MPPHVTSYPGMGDITLVDYHCSRGLAGIKKVMMGGLALQDA